MQAPASPTDQAFLIRVNGTQYLFEVTADDVTGTTILSAAAHFTYFEADRLCQKIKQQGHRVAVVCNVYGDPVSADELRGVQESSKPAPATHEDFELMARLITQDPQMVAQELGIPLSELLARIDAGLKRFDFTIDSISQSTQDAKDLLECEKTEHEERKQNNQRRQ